MTRAAIEDIRELRAETGAGVMDVKRALEDAAGDMDAAREVLKQRGLEKSAAKASRETHEGVVEAYIHPGRPLGALLELSCETDFVARTPDFRTLARDLVMHIAAMAPERISEDDEGDGAALLTQTWFRDSSTTVEEVLRQTIARVGENIRVRRFCRFEI